MSDELEEYLRAKDPGKVELAGLWRTAIGLQKVDGLTTSQYLVETARRNIEGEITIAEAGKLIGEYYKSKSVRAEAAKTRTDEADIVSQRIAGILAEPTFSFSPASYVAIHRKLFNGIYKHAGTIRDYNITKSEWVLKKDTVRYEGADMIAAVNQCSYDIYFAHEHMISGSHSSIDYFVTYTSHMDLVVHKNLADRVNMADWSELSDCRFVSALEAGFSLSGQIRRICRNRGIVPDIINYYNRADTVLLAVNSGVGISILPSTLIAFYNWPNVVAFPIEGSDALVSSIVAWNRSGGNPEVTRFLAISHLTELKKER